MPRQILITGGAGFIGSHLCDQLLGAGNRVRILDSLSAQVHGTDGARPEYLSPDAELVHGDVRDPEVVRKALEGVDAVYHFAAMVGVGQSMYRVNDYVSVNDLGTATLLQALIERPVERLVVASSMSIYGEGLYRDADGRMVETAERDVDAVKRGEWELLDAQGRMLMPVPTPESKRPALASVYALSKYVQERMCLMVGQAYGIGTTALRFFNAYGTRQALSNPYTGVLAIFAARLLNGNPPMIFEDGHQRRDFVHVSDVARACRMVLDKPEAIGRVFNVGSGQSRSVTEVAALLARSMGKNDIQPQVNSRYRVGDIRHCFADMTLAREVLGFEAEIAIEDGLAELVEWLSEQPAIDRVDAATRELTSRGLVA
ncbi:NAD-dependent epimerase/dehydratase family protein [Telmatospirillum sp. J64-1]|uniref:NAD-dependent epimerase/dehydratase family protein n=1 Tax=Telmatospirillum sp. J64-1 TaxID=2502183 RepID=UPI00115F0386|nr:NAD-dependent epimerase/dehydratase family protein [Telmatospirillum sp. J64-1]